MGMTRTLVAVSLAALVLAGCGEESPTEPGVEEPLVPGEDRPAVGGAMGPGLTVEEAVASDAQDPLLVNGFLVADGDVVRLCSVLAESFPPQCGEPSLQVVGVDLDDYPTQTDSGVTWTDAQVQILGEVDDGVLRVSSEESA